MESLVAKVSERALEIRVHEESLEAGRFKHLDVEFQQRVHALRSEENTLKSRCGVVWCGVVWCGVVWCGVVWCGVVWCGVVVSTSKIHMFAPMSHNLGQYFIVCSGYASAPSQTKIWSAAVSRCGVSGNRFASTSTAPSSCGTCNMWRRWSTRCGRSCKRWASTASQAVTPTGNRTLTSRGHSGLRAHTGAAIVTWVRGQQGTASTHMTPQLPHQVG